MTLPIGQHSDNLLGQRLKTGTLLPRLVIMLLLCLLIFPLTSSADDSIDDKAERVKRLHKEIKSLRTTLESDYGQRNKLENSLRSAELKIAKHSKSLRKLATQLSHQKARLRELNQDKQAQQHRLSEQQYILAQQVRASYAMGRQGYVKILLSNQDPAKIGRTMTYYKYFNQARARRINDIGISISELENLEANIVRETAQLESLLDQQQEQQAQRKHEYQNRNAVLAKLDSAIGSKEGQLKQMVQDKEQLVELLSKLQKALSDIPPDVGDLQPFGNLNGKLSLPTQGKIRHRFGARRKTGTLHWQGMTISANEGDEVKAIYHGRVAFADWLRNFGMLIIIDHGDGYMSLYAHNQALYKDVGEWVDQGDVIAAIGNSGGQDNTGLYFEIRHMGTPKDPARWMALAKH